MVYSILYSICQPGKACWVYLFWESIMNWFYFTEHFSFGVRFQEKVYAWISFSFILGSLKLELCSCCVPICSYICSKYYRVMNCYEMVIGLILCYQFSDFQIWSWFAKLSQLGAILMIEVVLFGTLKSWVLLKFSKMMNVLLQ
jgi:hypothetical protein